MPEIEEPCQIRELYNELRALGVPENLFHISLRPKCGGCAKLSVVLESGDRRRTSPLCKGCFNEEYKSKFVWHGGDKPVSTVYA